MQRFLMIAALALLTASWASSAADAQTVVYIGRPYIPVIVLPPPTTTYYVAPATTTVTYSSSYSYYPPVVPQTVVTYSAPVLVHYAVPAVVVVPTVVETRTTYSFGVLRPRGYYTEVRVRP
ncbi:MAG: hypothetical protein EXS16_17915 [Gemmataceae bacterium]|nr:hypothetical protein [Gemmataceae bacterium]